MALVLSLPLAKPALTAPSYPATFAAGASLCLSGAAGALGERMRQGMELAVEVINGSGGVDGTPLRVIFEDSRADPQTGVTVFNKLTAVDRVPVVYTCGTAVLLATIPLAEERGTLLLNTSASGPRLVGASRNLFNAYAMTTEQATIMARYMRERLNYRNVALVVRSDDYGRGTERFFTELWARLGGRVLGAVYHDFGTADHAAQIARLREFGDAEAVYLMTAGRDAATFIRQARDLGVTKPIVGLDGVEDQQVINLAGASAEGILLTSEWTDLLSGTPETRQFVRAFRAKYANAVPHPFFISYYNGVLIWANLARALKREGKPYTGTALREQLLKIKRFPVVGGNIVFRDDGSSTRPVAIKAIRGGQFIIVEVFRPR